MTTPAPRKRAAPRKRTPRTNPELAVRRAEKGPAPLVRKQDGDPPIFTETWNHLYAS